MKNNTNLKKLGALLLTGALMTGAIVGTNAIQAKAAGSGAENTFLLKVPAEITVYTKLEGVEDCLGIFTTSAMPTGKQITLSATTTNNFNLIKTDQNGARIPYQLKGMEHGSGNTVDFSSNPLTIDGTYMQAADAIIDEFSYAYRDIIYIAAIADQNDIDSAEAGDYEDEIKFTAKMEDKPQN